jgi:hypothetical protein
MLYKYIVLTNSHFGVMGVKQPTDSSMVFGVGTGSESPDHGSKMNI